MKEPIFVRNNTVKHKTITIPALADMHVHLRQGGMLESVARYTDRQCSHALIMPNTTPPIVDAAKVVEYRKEIDKHLKSCEPLMTIKLLPTTTPEQIKEAAKVASAVKIYPEGVTTNSEDSFSRRYFTDADDRLTECLRTAMNSCMIICFHGEMPGAEVLDAEDEFLGYLKVLIKRLPKIKFVLEHITSAKSVDFVKEHSNCAATITAHHLYLTLDDVVGAKIRPHNFCKPIAKRKRDRQALREAALSGSSRFFLGSDSAPHSKDNKECEEGCAGVFTSPILAELMVNFFAENNAVELLPNFVSNYGLDFYGHMRTDQRLDCYAEDTKIESCDGVVPFKHKESLKWRVCRSK